MRALTQLRDAYAAGHLSTATLEARVELALHGDVDAAVWDLGSCNGTYVNGRRVQRARLRRGDELLLGETVVRVR